VTFVRLSGSGLGLPHVDGQLTILGFEILLPDPHPSVGLPAHRGRIWIEGANGLHLLYGKNGAGKTTLLRAICDLFEGRKSATRIHCFVRLQDDVRKGIFGRPSEEINDPAFFSVSGWARFVQDAAHSIQLEEREGGFLSSNASHFLSVAGLEWDEDKVQEVLTSDLAQRLTPLEVRPWEEVARYFLAIQLAYDAISRGYRAVGSVQTEAIGEIATSGILRLSPNGKSGSPSWKVDLAASVSGETPGLLQMQSETRATLRDYLCELYPEAANSDADLERVCSLFLFGVGELEEHLRNTDSGLLRSRQNIEELFGLLPEPKHNLVTYEVDGWWGLEIKRPLPGWPTLLRLDDSTDLNGWIRNSFGSVFGQEAPLHRKQAHRPSLDQATRRVLDGLTGSEVYIHGGPEGGRVELDGHLIRKDVLNNVQVEEVTSTSKGAAEGLSESPLMWTSKDSDRIEGLARQVSKFGEILPLLKIGLGGLRLEPDWNIASWLEGTPAELKALDEPSGEWVSVDELSDAQRRWVGNALTIGQARETSQAMVLVGDEVDAGVHVKASMSIFSTLSSLPGVGFVTSHSPTALRTPRARLLFVGRDADGKVIVDSGGLASDVVAAAEVLGVDVTDLLASKYLTVVVEGTHDEIVLEGILKGENILDRMLIIPGRGTYAMKGIPDAKLLVEFTDHRILVVVDNTRGPRLQPVVESLKSAHSHRKSKKAGLKESGLKELQSKATPEEKMVLEVVERSYLRGFIDRLDLHGLPTRDVVDLLPAESFGLDIDWPQLREKHRRGRKGRDFKTWVRETHGVSIKEPTVKSAVENLDGYSEGLSDLRLAVERALTRATLERGLSN